VTESPNGWIHEKESAWLYLQVAACEPDPTKRRLFEQLGAAAEQQALMWQPANPGRDVQFSPSLRSRIVAAVVRRTGPRKARAILAAMKLRGVSVYTSVAAPGHAMPTTVANVGERHRGVSGGNLRATVFGANDGLISNASLLMGVAGAGTSSDALLLTGVAGLLAGALSMAAGEYVSVRSQREMYEYQIGLEKDELAEYPDEEAEELALIYHARGIELEQARTMSRTLLADPVQALDVLAREELGLNPDDLGSPWGAALSSFGAFSVGALLPLVPLLLGMSGSSAVIAIVGVTALALAVLGLVISLFTGRGALLGALRMLLIGGGAGLAAFLVGRLLGVVIG
jgi:VIT1/CCC1 family predicted Fe2+/Mn2+ transporter